MYHYPSRAAKTGRVVARDVSKSFKANQLQARSAVKNVTLSMIYFFNSLFRAVILACSTVYKLRRLR